MYVSLFCFVVTKSADTEEEPSSLSLARSSSNEGEPSLEDILAGHLKEDPVLYGVSQMLSILKQHVTKPKVKYVPYIHVICGFLHI
jgi:hypothetical protein